MTKRPGPPPPPPRKRARTARPRARSSVERIDDPIATEALDAIVAVMDDAIDAIVDERSAPVARPRAASEPVRRARTPAPRAATPAPTDALPIPPLRVAVWESHGHLAAAQTAILAAGHDIAGAAAGAEGIAAIEALVRTGDVDALLIGLPPVAPGTPLHDGAAGDAAGALLDAAHSLAPRRPVIIAAVAGGLPAGARRAVAAGADLVCARPHDADRIAAVLLAAARLASDRAAITEAQDAEAAARARLEAVTDGEPGGLQPYELFQGAVELEIKRAQRYAYPLSVALFAIDLEPPPPPPGVRGILRARIGTALLHAIRDIDLVTQLDQERFLVLLPYTDLTGAAVVGQRVIAEVATGPAVSAAGRTFPLRVIGAVAGGGPGQPQSFARLLRDVSRALEQARQDGAELAVQP